MWGAPLCDIMTTYVRGGLLAEVSLQQALESLAMTSLILGHLVHGVVDGIEVGSLGSLGDVELALASATLSLSTLLEVGLGVPYKVADELAELSCMLGLLESVAIESLANLGITLTVCLARHGQIHTYL